MTIWIYCPFGFIAQGWPVQIKPSLEYFDTNHRRTNPNQLSPGMFWVLFSIRKDPKPIIVASIYFLCIYSPNKRSFRGTGGACRRLEPPFANF